ncbi:MAG: DUF502 domain-containing protein [Candidatus Lernaella stagnicola]|nr:DUF502 domain-containing protein [Candidatus Lernaella stagnicola]
MPDSQHKSPKRSFLIGNWRTDVRNYLVAGLLVTVPLGTTILVLRWVLRIADGMIKWLPEAYRPETYLGIHIPGVFGLTLFILFLLIVGFLVRNFIGQRLVRVYENILERIPFVRTVYVATKQLTSSLFATDGNKFSRVVLIEYPRPGLYSMAFVTSEHTKLLSNVIGRRCLSVFVPTTPNPTSGYYLLVPIEDAVDTDLSIEEAFRLIMSAGISTPERADVPAPTVQPPAPAPAEE